MPPPYRSSYDPAAGFRAATNPYGAKRPRQPWGLDWPSWRDALTPPQVDYLEQVPYRPPGARGYPSSSAFNYGEVGAPPAPPTIYADPGQAAMYGGTTRPAGYGDVAPGQVTAVPTQPAPPTSEEEYWLNRWAVEQSEREAVRQQHAYEYDTSRQDQRQAALVNAFGVFGEQRAPQATGQAGEAMNARSAIQQERMQAGELRNKLWQNGIDPLAEQAQLFGAQVTAPPLNPRPSMALPDRYQMRNAYTAGEARLAAPYNPRPEWISGPQFGMSVDEGARNTMRGNQAFGIHVDRGSDVRQAGQNPQDQARFNRMVDDTSPEGEQAWAEYEQFVLGGSPRRSILERGEDAGTMTPAERAYLMGLRRRRGAGR